MNVNFEKTDQVNGVLTVQMVEDDYKGEVKKELNHLGQTRPIKGFRPGHVPAALLQKFYGPQVKAQIIDRKLNRAVSDYIINNKIAILGEPMMTDDTHADIDKDNEFEFKFELGIAPEFDINIDKDITIPYYNIQVTDDMVEKQNDGYRKRFGKQVPGEEAAIDSMLRGSMVELDENGQEKAEGIKAERTIIMPQYLKNEEQQQKFVGAKVGQEIVFNPNQACDGSASEMASMLNIDKENAADVTSDFKMTVDEIMVTQIAEMDQEFFDNVLGKDEAKTEEEYKAKLKEIIAHELVADSNYRFTIDAEAVLRGKVGDLALPDEFLKKFLMTRDEKNTAEKVEEEYPAAKAHLQWQLIKDRAAASLQVKVDDSDRKRLARLMAAQQFAQYGMTNLPDDVVDNYAQKLLEDERYQDDINNRAFDDKFFAALKDAVTLDEKNVSIDEFNKLFEAK
ncbi:MAG: trigger factor [Muribaculaceae bacterium]|nr:trigger factor [Muribaculaceae bacterium]